MKSSTSLVPGILLLVAAIINALGAFINFLLYTSIHLAGILSLITCLLCLMVGITLISKFRKFKRTSNN